MKLSPLAFVPSCRVTLAAVRFHQLIAKVHRVYELRGFCPRRDILLSLAQHLWQSLQFLEMIFR
jgi:hypothetical protein